MAGTPRGDRAERARERTEGSDEGFCSSDGAEGADEEVEQLVPTRKLRPAARCHLRSARLLQHQPLWLQLSSI